MAASKEQILDAISNMTVMEVVDLVKMMEDKFGVTAATPVAMAAVGATTARSSLGPILMELVKTRVSQINGCAFCVDMHVRDLRRHGETWQRINSLCTWRETALYSPRERAALAWAEEVTRKLGYKFLLGGNADPSGTGYFVPLTIIDNPPEDARIVAEEQFGPVMPLMKFSTINEVISRANASDYGLAGSIWTSNPEAAVEVAEQLETGTVWINESMHLAPNAPFAGHKQSGFGAELGEEGLLEFTYPQVITIAREAA